MRDAFFQTLADVADADPRVMLLSADLGYKLFDNFHARCPGRFLNMGVAEANMIGVAAGLALAGKRPFAYSIATFATARCLEQIRIDLCEMHLPVVVVGVGAGYAYGPNGPTHHAVDDIALMRSLPSMTVVVPCDPRETAAAVRALLDRGGPAYLRLGRSSDPTLPGTERFTLGVPNLLRKGHGIALVTCGSIAAEVLEAAEVVGDPAVFSVHTVKPLGLGGLGDYDHVFVIEEHGPCGGLYEAVAGEIRHPSLHRISAPDRFHRRIGSTSFLRRASGLDSASIAKRILDTVGK